MRIAVGILLLILATSLSASGDALRERCYAMLYDERAHERRAAAANTLAEIGLPGDLDTLGEIATRDPHAGVRAACTNAVCAIGIRADERGAVRVLRRIADNTQFADTRNFAKNQVISMCTSALDNREARQHRQPLTALSMRETHRQRNADSAAARLDRDRAQLDRDRAQLDRDKTDFAINRVAALESRVAATQQEMEAVRNQVTAVSADVERAKHDPVGWVREALGTTTIAALGLALLGAFGAGILLAKKLSAGS